MLATEEEKSVVGVLVVFTEKENENIVDAVGVLTI